MRTAAVVGCLCAVMLLPRAARAESEAEDSAAHPRLSNLVMLVGGFGYERASDTSKPNRAVLQWLIALPMSRHVLAFAGPQYTTGVKDWRLEGGLRVRFPVGSRFAFALEGGSSIGQGDPGPFLGGGCTLRERSGTTWSLMVRRPWTDADRYAGILGMSMKFR